MSQDVVELTKSLVSIPSITNDEGRIGRYVRDALAEEGWVVTTQEVAPEGAQAPQLSRMNVLAKSDEGAPRVVLSTHLDTVPPFIPPTEDDRYLYGRGTCDAKGIFAAQWVAANRLRAEGRTGIGLLGIVGEETDSIGAKIAHELLPSANFIIDGEPTDLKMSSGAKGILAMRLRLRGVAGHSAYPEVGRSAVHDMIAALGRLLGAELPSEERFGSTSVNVGKLTGGVAPNVIAPHCEAVLMIRLGTESGVVLDAISQHLGPEVEIEITSRSEPQEIFVPGDLEREVVRFGSDVPYLRKIGTPLLVGPGSIHDAHTAGEKIEKRSLHEAVDLYTNLARTLLDLEDEG